VGNQFAPLKCDVVVEHKSTIKVPLPNTVNTMDCDVIVFDDGDTESDTTAKEGESGIW
jgi:hypothetical protein